MNRKSCGVELGVLKVTQKDMHFKSVTGILKSIINVIKV